MVSLPLLLMSWCVGWRKGNRRPNLFLLLSDSAASDPISSSSPSSTATSTKKLVNSLDKEMVSVQPGPSKFSPTSSPGTSPRRGRRKPESESSQSRVDEEASSVVTTPVRDRERNHERGYAKMRDREGERRKVVSERDEEVEEEIFPSSNDEPQRGRSRVRRPSNQHPNLRKR